MSKQFIKLNEKLKPYYSLITMIIFFSGLFISAYKFIISPSDLRVTIQTEQVSYPNSLGNYYEKLDNYIIHSDTLIGESRIIYNFLLRTTDHKKITLKNTSSKTLRDVKFKQLNTEALTAWSISSDFLTSDEEQNLKKNIDVDEIRQILYFTKPIDIAPNSQINIEIWGNFKNEILNNNLIINHSNGDGHIEESYSVSGLKGYFVNYSFEFLALLILIFIAVYHIGIKYSKKQ
ncbi:hypothetical protein [Gelidibacter maritimus]|uniref:Uncharacterized protein n=1 Tax=Gelidibacter maritimus TaxID=2761487 RepID=A0A7W2M5H4_9FLAO|nr:hypothetical protein [Gelidibacter maritimus]MBA6153069.1 hypothetical protein [Gelidibacter maritimus]